MLLHDLRAIDVPAPIEADVCIVGSGPAGWAVAEQLRDSKLRLIMLESGGVLATEESSRLNAIQDVGVRTHNGRVRALGGTSGMWYGRCIPLDDIDYEPRDWVPHSGWPLDARTMSPFLARACELLGTRPWQSDGLAPVTNWPSAYPQLDPSQLREVWWEDTTPVDSGRMLLMCEQPNLRVLVNATVTHLNTDETGRVIESVEVACSSDTRTTVRARAVVLCAGGIENARILLYSNRVNPAGVGNERDVVGRYFMDHPRDPRLAVRFDPNEALQARKLFGPHRLDTGRGRKHEFSRGVALSPERQRREALLNCAALPFEFVAQDDPTHAVMRLITGRHVQWRQDVRSVLAHPGLAALGLHSIANDGEIRRKTDMIGLLITSEQVPDPDSRIRLASERDYLGLPISEIDWRINAQDVGSQATFAKIIASEFQRMGLPDVQLADWVLDAKHEGALFQDGCHPMGTTRMAEDPRCGVVNSDCKVHGVDGLYIAGSSVFPTGSHANPTLMLVALAIRLADHLRTLLAAGDGQSVDASAMPVRRDEVTTEAAAGSVLAAGTTAAITGATGFIGARLSKLLVEQGVKTVALTRDRPGRNSLAPGTEPRVVDLCSADATRAALEDVDVVFHCAYDSEEPDWNVRAIRGLIDACRGSSGCRIVHLSSFVVYRVPDAGTFTEDTPEQENGSGYAHVKQLLEAELLKAVREGIQMSILQPTMVYGPRSRVWTIDPADCLRYGTVVLPGDGSGVCNALYVDDLVRAMILAATQPAALGERFLISGPPIPWAEFYEQIAKVVQADAPQYAPVEVILDEKKVLRKVRRLLTDPIGLLRTCWYHPIGREVLARFLQVLPPEPREIVKQQLLLPRARWKRLRHLPNLGFIQSHAVASTEKARHVIGFEPEFDFAAGMIATSLYLEQYVKLNP